MHRGTKNSQTNIGNWRDFHTINNPLNAGGMWMISTKRHSLFELLKNINKKISKADEGAHEIQWQLALECFNNNDGKNI